MKNTESKSKKFSDDRNKDNVPLKSFLIDGKSKKKKTKYTKKEEGAPSENA